MAIRSISQTVPLAAGIYLVLLLAAAKCVHPARVLVQQPPVAAPASSSVKPDPQVDPALVVPPPSAAAAPQPSNPISSPLVATPPPPAFQITAPDSSEADVQPLIFFMQPSALILNNAGTLTPSTDKNNENSGDLLQSPPFGGATTVIDNQLTESQESASKAVGRAQGIYVASSRDGTSQVLIATAVFNAEGDGASKTGTLSFLGVYCPSLPDSRIAIVGGTGEYESSRGYAVVKSFPGGQQAIDSAVETCLQFTIYLS